MLLLMMDSFAKERSVVSKRTTDSTAHESASAKGKEKEATTSKSADTNRNADECRNERKVDNDDVATDRSKFKKVEMSVFTGEDPDSWLVRAERYFQIHKLTESEKNVNIHDKLRRSNLKLVSFTRRER